MAKASEANASDGVLAQLRRLPEGQEFTNVQEVAEALGLGTEQRRFCRDYDDQRQFRLQQWLWWHLCRVTRRRRGGRPDA